MDVWHMIGIALAAIIIVFFAAQFFRGPVQMVWLLVRSAIIGFCGLFIINYIGQGFHFHIGFNWVTASVAGILGIPGLIALVVIKLWFFPI